MKIKKRDVFRVYVQVYAACRWQAIAINCSLSDFIVSSRMLITKFQVWTLKLSRITTYLQMERETRMARGWIMVPPPYFFIFYLLILITFNR